MAVERRSFRVYMVAVALVAMGILLGVSATIRWDMGPVAQSEVQTHPATLPAPVAGVATAAAAPSNIFVPVVKSASPAVVNISTSREVKQAEVRSPFQDDPFFKHFFGDEFLKRFNGPRKREENSLGSGVIVDASGYIITNNHVVSKADEITVVLSDEREFEGKLIGTDPKTDLAVIKIEAKNLPTVPWGDSDKLDVGEYVLAIGNPFGLNQTITMGIVSAVGRANVGIADYEDFIQTDAAINPGNSGGALVNVNGQLIGINTAIFSRSGGYMGIGFAVPSNMARTVMDSLVKHGKVTRGWLGVSIQQVTKELAKQFDLKEPKGALVGEVIADSPAKKAGLKDGDVIVKFDGNEIDSPTTLRNMVARTAVGKSVKVEVIRDGRMRTLSVAIAEQPAEVAGATPEEEEGAESSALAGLSVRSVSPEILEQLGLPADTTGVVVSSVENGSAAQEAGLRTGDVIMELNRKRVTSVADFNNVAKSIKKGRNILLRIKRKGGKFFIVIKPK